jgi:hypothetical protein
MKEELKRYKSALWKYKLCLYLPFLKPFLYTNIGFCFHFDSYNSMKYDLPILYNLKPPADDIQEYWFSKGHLKPRIKLLEKAIEICEQQNKTK